MYQRIPDLVRDGRLTIVQRRQTASVGAALALEPPIESVSVLNVEGKQLRILSSQLAARIQRDFRVRAPVAESPASPL